MPCYHPLRAYQAQPGARISFPKSGASNLKLPCNRCIGCRLERSKQWAIRLMHEAAQHKANSFVTLTYDDKHLAEARGDFEDSAPRALRRYPAKRHANYTVASLSQSSASQDSLVKRHAQLFMKRLRKELTTRNPSARVRYYLVGEYGDKNQRPHYHAALFGEDFAGDRYQWRKSPAGHQLWRSPRLEKAWDRGHCEIGNLDFESAAYIARYVMKKITGPMADDHYRRTNLTTGETYYITPEFALMSRGGKGGKGIGSTWFEQFSPDIYPHDYVVMRGQKHKPPRYYDKLLEQLDKEAATLIKLERHETAQQRAEDNTPQRLRVRETVALARAAQKTRPLE